MFSEFCLFSLWKEIFQSHIMIFVFGASCHYVVSCFVVLFALIFIIIWPVFDHLIRGDEFPLNHLKGQICTKLPLNLTDPDTKRKHQKPKMIIGGLGL